MDRDGDVREEDLRPRKSHLRSMSPPLLALMASHDLTWETVLVCALTDTCGLSQMRMWKRVALKLELNLEMIALPSAMMATAH